MIVHRRCETVHETGRSSSAFCDPPDPPEESPWDDDLGDDDGPNLEPSDLPPALLWGEETDLWRWVPTDPADDDAMAEGRDAR